METMKETAEDKLIRSIWGTALPAVVAVAGVIVEDGFAAQSGVCCVWGWLLAMVLPVKKFLC